MIPALHLVFLLTIFHGNVIVTKILEVFDVYEATKTFDFVVFFFVKAF